MYPRLLRRVQAVLIDSVITPIVLFASILLVSKLSIDGDVIRGLLSLGPAISMEPLLVAATGGTIGHHVIGIKVRRVDEDKCISVFHAFSRFFLKVLFGIPSLVFVLVTKRHQAIHDLLSHAIVVHKSTENLASNEMLDERTNEAGYLYPRAIRRILIIFAYIILISISTSIVIGILVPTNCLEFDLCKFVDSMILNIASIIYWLLLSAVIVAGWKSRLYGCRRIRNDDMGSANNQKA